MCFLSQKWSSSTSQYSIALYLSGGFDDQTVTTAVTEEPNVVPELSSTYEEADMRMMKHAVYSADVLGAERIVVDANDTDVIVSCIYFCEKHQTSLEVWVRTDTEVFIPIHKIAASLGREVSATSLLPCIFWKG